jgi:NAD(P)-dependent dehydrogenase (short-subunit alcohol dehydrogenase family)
VNLSSLGHFLFPGDTPLDLSDVERGSPNADPWRLYGISKLANVLHAKELQRRMDAEGANVSAVALHPGAILGTSLARHLGLGPVYHMLTYGRVWTHGFAERNKSIPEGVATTILASLAPFDGGAPGSSSSSSPLTPPAIAIPKGSYLVNSAVATSAVNPLVSDPDSARLMWELSERMVAKAMGAK